MRASSMARRRVLPKSPMTRSGSPWAVVSSVGPEPSWVGGVLSRACAQTVGASRVLLLAVLASGCGAPPAPIRLELADKLGDAMVLRETGRLDIGAAAARRHLREGWSHDEVAADGTSFVWSVGGVSVVEAFLLRPRPLELAFRCWPFAPAGVPPQSVKVRAGGRDFEKVALGPGPAEYRVRLPADVVHVGWNRIELSYAYHLAPRDAVPGAGDERPLAVGWDWVELKGAPPAAPSAVANPPTLVLPATAGLRFSLRMGPEDRLAWDRIERTGGGEAHVRIILRTRRGAVEHRLSAPAGAGTLDLPLAGEEWAALELLPEVATADGTVRLVHPVLRGPGRPAQAPPPSPPARRPNVLLYVIDTLRADHLGCYGYGRRVSPGLDAFAAGATLFENARAAASWTKTSMATVLTGLPPRSHGTHRRGDALSPALTTLAERLQQAGYATAGFVTNPNLAPSFGFDQGFDTYVFLTEKRVERGYVRSDVLHHDALTWLEHDRPSDRPFFLYLHSMDPHDPYVTAGGEQKVGTTAFMRALEQGRIPVSPVLRQQLLALYDDEIAFNDAGLAALLSRLDASGLGRDTLVVVLADHGEEFFDHGWWRHGKTLFEEQLRIPLLVRWPGGWKAGVRVERPARQIDVAPTILEAVGLGADAAGLPGRGLARLAAGTAVADEPEFALLDVDGRWVESLRLGPSKLVRYFSYDRPRGLEELFDLGADPLEAANIAALQPEAVAFLGALLESPAFGGRPGVVGRATIDADLAERLRAVGYVH